jgi:hypothetical protein
MNVKYDRKKVKAEQKPHAPKIKSKKEARTKNRTLALRAFKGCGTQLRLQRPKKNVA